MSADSSAARVARSRAVGSRAFWVGVCIFTLLGAFARVAYVEIISRPLPPISDASGYYRMGQHMAEGRGFVSSNIRRAKSLHPTASYPPLYPAFLGLLNRVGIEAVQAQRLTIAALGAINVPLLALVGRSFGGPVLGLLAAGLAAFAPALIEIDGAFMSEALYVPLVILTFLAILRAYTRQSAAAWAVAGSVLGLASLARSEGLLLFALLALPLAFLSATRNRRWVSMLAVAIGLAALVLPWTVRNALTFGAFIPVSENYKGAILGANCAEIYDTPKYRGHWSFPCVQAFDFSGETESEIWNRARDQGLRFAFEHREQLPQVALARLVRTWGLYDPRQWPRSAENEMRSSQFQQRTWWFGWLLLALAPIGLFALGRQSRIHLWILAAPILMVCITTVIGYGNTRFRAGAEPSLLLLAAIAILRNRLTPLGSSTTAAQQSPSKEDRSPRST